MNMSSPRAIISYDRLRAGASHEAGDHFDLCTLKKALHKAGVASALFHISAAPDTARLNLLPQRLDFTLVRKPSDSARFFEAALEAELLHNRRYGPRPILIFGAKTSEAALIHELRAAQNTVMVFHWIGEFDAAILKATDCCYALSSCLVLNIHERQLAAFVEPISLLCSGSCHANISLFGTVFQ